MPQMRSAFPPIRMLCAGMLALLLALRMLSPAGFMPAFDHGAVSIVACPDYETVPQPMPHHLRNHGAKHDHHQPCPYAAGASVGTAPDLFLFAATLVFRGTLLVDRKLEFAQARRRHERPPLRGPPVNA